MKIFSKVCLSFLLASTFIVLTHAQENQTYIIHTIQKGQSLYSISNMYGIRARSTKYFQQTTRS